MVGEDEKDNGFDLSNQNQINNTVIVANRNGVRKEIRERINK